MVELYLHLHMKICLDYFRGRLKYAKIGKSMHLKLLRLYHNTYIFLFRIDLSTKLYWGLFFNWTHHLLFQYMSVKIYTIFFLSSGDYNFKANYLKDKMRHGMWVHILLNNTAPSPLPHSHYFWHRRSKCCENVVKFYQQIFEFKVLCYL